MGITHRNRPSIHLERQARVPPPVPTVELRKHHATQLFVLDKCFVECDHLQRRNLRESRKIGVAPQIGAKGAARLREREQRCSGPPIGPRVRTRALEEDKK